MAYEEVLSALADNTRRGILETLRAEPQSVTALSRTQTVSRPAVSQHLKVLHEAGLVTVNQSGNKRVYAIRRDGLAELRQYLDTYWTDVLQAFANEIERTTGDEDARTHSKNH